MELITPEHAEPQYRQFGFTGKGLDLFKIYIVNWILSVITLGLYYPWAKAAQLKYKYQNTIFDGSSFVFHGTGAEIFRGFIKIVGLFIAFIIVYAFAIMSQNTLFIALAVIVFYAILIIIAPIAIHSSAKYRTSRSSWRGIHFGYRGILSEFVKLFTVNIILTIFTLGIYGSWATDKFREYIIGNIRFGNIKFKYLGTGTELFFINLKGIIFTFLSFGIYLFWFQMNLVEYFIENIEAEQNGEKLNLRYTGKGGDFFAVAIVNFLIVVFTFGLGFAWAEIRMINFITQNIWVEGNFDANNLNQTEQEYKDASGDDMLDMLDLDLGIV